MKVKSQNCLGIYLDKDKATVVCLGFQGRQRQLLSSFSISIENQQQEQNLQTLTGLIAKGCTDRGLEFSEIAVALDCAMFMQHKVHTEFNDPKKIAATVRFDTEEALATDIADVAIAFQIASGGQNGSELIVFTTQRKLLSDIIFALQTNGLDPAAIEPDISCLSRFVAQNVSLPDSPKQPFLFGIFARHRGYFLVFSDSRKISPIRTILLDHSQNREQLITREAIVTSALIGAGESISDLRIYDSVGSTNLQLLAEKLGIEVAGIDLVDSAGIEPQALIDCDDPVGFAIAYGATLTHLHKQPAVNFRNDFMPYQGKKLRLQRALKFASASITILLIAVGLYFQTQLFKVKNYRTELRNKFELDYLAVMLGERQLPTKFQEAVRKLGGVSRRIESERKGLITDQEAISAKLTLVLEAFNNCAQEADLNIDTISITSKNISITGDTSGRRNTLKLFQEIQNVGLEIVQQNLNPKNRRDNFSITVLPKK